MKDDPEQTGGGVNRREMLALGLASGAALATAQLGSGNERQREPGPGPHLELEEETIAGLRRAMDEGRINTRSLAEMYIERIEALDSRGPHLRSVLEIDPEILAHADRLDRERIAGSLRSPLHGIPVILKDNIDTADRMLTTAGSQALIGATPQRDAFIVTQLRQAGALILGKANLSEWANFRSTHSSSGWSGRGGQCRNPYALDRSPCGSSSGTAVAVAANLVTVGIGTETDGSVVCPSHVNSLVGIKPTVGLVSRSGIIPISYSQDTAGPMARTVADAAMLLAVVSGIDPRDPATASSAGRTTDFARALDRRALKGARIGVARKKFFGYSAHADAIIEQSLDALKSAGAVLVDPADIPHAGDYNEDEWEVLVYEFKAGLNAYLAGLGETSPMKTLADIIAFNEAHAAVEMPYFSQEIFEIAAAKGPLTDQPYREALARCQRLSRIEGIDRVIEEHKLDAIVAPTGSPAWTIDLINGDNYLGSSSTPAAVSGYPNITVPAGYAYGLPVGISFIGKAWTEARLIALAFAFEQETQIRRPPKYPQSAM